MFYLKEDDCCSFFDNWEMNVRNLCSFIDQAQENCDCVLIHSVHGNSRSLFVAAVYLMAKYHWKASEAIFAVSTCCHARMNLHFEEQLH
jgi:protein-tyrosine phosphatase